MMLVSTAKPPPSHDPFLHAQRHHRLEQLAQEIALTETAVAVLGKCRMIGDVGIEPQATEPAIGQTSSHSRRSERMPKPSPTMSIRIINSGSIEGRPTSLY
jgi:hypothetical protein